MKTFSPNKSVPGFPAELPPFVHDLPHQVQECLDILSSTHHSDGANRTLNVTGFNRKRDAEILKRLAKEELGLDCKEIKIKPRAIELEF